VLNLARLYFDQRCGASHDSLCREDINMTMLNTLELVESIIRHPEDLETAIVEHAQQRN
jgi:hypothetical protein